MDDLHEFSEGDLVRIIPPDFDEQESLIEAIGYAEEMDEEVGRVTAIAELSEFRGYDCYMLDGSKWLWAREWLELVESNKDRLTFTDNDFDSVFDGGSNEGKKTERDSV